MLVMYLQVLILHLESAIYTIKLNTFKLLKYMNKDNNESAIINPGPNKETFFYIIIRNYGLIMLFKKITGIRKMLMKL